MASRHTRQSVLTWLRLVFRSFTCRPQLSKTREYSPICCAQRVKTWPTEPNTHLPCLRAKPTHLSQHIIHRGMRSEQTRHALSLAAPARSRPVPPSTRRARTDPARCAQYVPTRSAAPSTCAALLRRLCCSRSAPTTEGSARFVVGARVRCSRP